MIEFTVPGEPKGKGRPRFTTRGGFPKTYTPKDTREYEDMIRECYFLQCGQTQFPGAVSVEIVARFGVPKSTSRRDRVEMLAGIIPHTKKPDVDNIGKVVLDALNGVAFPDDKAVVSLFIRKEYAESPEILVKISGYPNLARECP